MSQYEVYFDYLKQRSFIGKFYRSFWLYPILSRMLKGKMLDIGCGIGDMLVFRPNSIGVDVNLYNVDYCLSRGCDARLMHNDLLPFGDGSFDSVLLDNVLEHVQDPMPLLLEIKRVLGSTGVLLIGVPGPKGYTSDPDHKVYYDEDRLLLLARNSGFVVKKTIYLPLWRSNFLAKRMRQYCLYTHWSV